MGRVGFFLPESVGLFYMGINNVCSGVDKQVGLYYMMYVACFKEIIYVQMLQIYTVNSR